MSLPRIWFPLDEESDLQNVLNFLQMLPANMASLIDADNSSFLRLYAIRPEMGINPELFTESFQEARQEFSTNLEVFQGTLREEKNLVEAEQTLRRTGFSGQSLRLKANLLNGIWRKVLDSIRDTGRDFLDLATDPVVVIFRKFLKFLNSILGSLKALMPGIDSIKEIKEIKENLIDLGKG